MRFARFAVVLRSRARLLPPDSSAPIFEEALHELADMARYSLTEEAAVVRHALSGIMGFDPKQPYELAQLDALSDTTIRRLDVLIEVVTDGTWGDKLLRDALRPALLRRVQ